MFCARCGAQNDDNNYQCVQCGQTLHGAPPAIPVSSGNDAVEIFIPYKNSNAVIAYYLGVFSLIPCVGLLIGIPAFVLGLKGLKACRENPQIKGATHAWVGIVAGGFFGLLNIVMVIFAIILSATS